MQSEKQKNIIIYVMNLPGDTAMSVRQYEKELGGKLRILLLRDSKVNNVKPLEELEGVDIAVSCDFSKPEKIAEALLPYKDELLAITCRAEKHMSRFAQVIPHVPYLHTPTTESLKWASDKYEMRKRLRLYDKKITPKFTLIKDTSKKERQRVVEKVGFPMIVKPANMVASMFVTICYHEEELDKTLRSVFRKIKMAYDKDDRQETPKIIAEEYMDGDMYSVDTYVTARGKVTHCPLVKVKTGKDIGHDDFYNYLQMTPSALKSHSVDKAQEVAKKAVHALGLRSTLAHIELMKIDDEWKVIEVGARMGGFRHVLHELSCGINHSLNDVLVRIPAKTIVPKKCQGYACAMKWFADKEGRINELKGIKKIEKLTSFKQIIVKKKVGDRAVFARNGGRSVFDLYLHNIDRSKLLADIRRVEKLVEIKIAPRKKKEN